VNPKIFAILFVVLAVACAAPTALPAPTALATPAPVSTATSAPLPTVATLGARERITLRELPGVGRAPNAIVALGDKFYTLNSATENIAILQNDRVVKFIPLKKPIALAADPAQKRLYVASADRTITLLANDQIALTQTIGEEPAALLFQENRLLVASASKAQILILDPATLQTIRAITIPNAFGVINLAGDPIRHRVYAAIYEKIVVLDSNTGQILTTLATKGSYFTLAVPPSGENIFVALYDSPSNTQYLTALDPTTGAARGRVKIGGDPRGALFSSDGARVYVANSFANTISVIDPRALIQVAQIAVYAQPYALALDETARRLYVANYGSDNVSVIDLQTNQVVAAIPLGMNVTALIADESARRVFVANASTDSVFVIEGARVVKEIGVGRHPIDLARDAPNKRVLVANSADGTLALIDEATLTARVTPPITRTLTTIAVDETRARLFANGVILDAQTFAPAGQLTARGSTIGSIITPQFIRFNPNLNRIYAIGWNGIPGSNSRNVTYSIDGATLQSRGTLSYAGNHDHLALDPKTNRVFIAGTHPMAFTNELAVFDPNDNKMYALALAARPAGMIFNPETNHLFLSLIANYARSGAPTPAPVDNPLLVLDANSFGEVARLPVNAPGKMARLGNTIYVANRNDGSITLVQDLPAPAPPAPTATHTPTPYPSATLASSSPRASATVPRATATPPICAIPLLSLQRWTMEMATRLGCPTETDRAGNYATQKFENGVLFWREDDKRILVLFNDKTWLQFNDTWTSALPEDTCPTVTVASGLLKPRRGFGKLWCDQPAVRAKLGAAIENEIGPYVALTQRFERGWVFIGTDRTHVYALYADGRWE